jgi:hypothetical protein
MENRAEDCSKQLNVLKLRKVERGKFLILDKLPVLLDFYRILRVILDKTTSILQHIKGRLNAIRNAPGQEKSKWINAVKLLLATHDQEFPRHIV